MNGKKREITIADGHVHIHECFDIEKFFDSAWANFFAISNRLGFGASFTGILFLTESINVSWFSHFWEIANGDKEKVMRNLEFQMTGEKNSLRVQFQSNKGLILIAGRQIISHESLEVLALGVREHFGEGNSITEIIQEVHSRGCISVIPWGVGKWIGRRAAIMKKLIHNDSQLQFYLGDNGNRPFFWPQSLLFKRAARKGIKILPGSDPLPFSSEVNTSGSFGFFLQNEVDLNAPAGYLTTLLKHPNTQINRYGNLESPLRFVTNQLRMRLQF